MNHSRSYTSPRTGRIMRYNLQAMGGAGYAHELEERADAACAALRDQRAAAAAAAEGSGSGSGSGSVAPAAARLVAGRRFRAQAEAIGVEAAALAESSAGEAPEARATILAA